MLVVLAVLGRGQSKEVKVSRLTQKTTCNKGVISYRTPSLDHLHEPQWTALLQDEGMPVDAGHQAQANGSSYGLGDFALVLGP